jgi:hypothetical protein
VCPTVVNPKPSYFCRSILIMGNSRVVVLNLKFFPKDLWLKKEQVRKCTLSTTVIVHSLYYRMYIKNLLYNYLDLKTWKSALYSVSFRRLLLLETFFCPVSFHGVIHNVAPYVYRNSCRASCNGSVIAHFNQNWIVLTNFNKTRISFHENLFLRYSICFMCTERRINRTIAKGASKGRECTIKHSFGSLVSSVMTRVFRDDRSLKHC